MSKETGKSRKRRSRAAGKAESAGTMQEQRSEKAKKQKRGEEEKQRTIKEEKQGKAEKQANRETEIKKKCIERKTIIHKKKSLQQKIIPWTRHVGSRNITPTRGSQIGLYLIMGMVLNQVYHIEPHFVPMKKQLSPPGYKVKAKGAYFNPSAIPALRTNRSTKLVVVFGLHPLYIPISPIV